MILLKFVGICMNLEHRPQMNILVSIGLRLKIIKIIFIIS
nr:MAG TPA: hypothetical protein [Caudoviricetes sp.]